MTNVIAAILTALLWGWGYLAFIDTNNPRVLDSEVRGEDGKPKRVFKVGEVVYIYRHWCVDRLATGDVDVEIYRLESGEFFYLGSRAAGAQVGCTKRTSMNRLPFYLPAGTYEYRAKITYSINPLRTVVFAAPVLTFEVVR